MTDKKINLPQKTINQLIKIFSAYPEIEKVIVFGSRAMGNEKPGSDVDLAISGLKVTSELVVKIHSYLEEETLFPYFFDCLHFETLTNPDLRSHILEYGKILYHRD
ncbi:nucleotidyltransferase domain-containing protein [uncultured Desulfobacter sp.]|uniref:nucleotidyltransferase family protein n=1 Tax=uncultured Desulfobacter sp. TaxID=240139 RepID=UPI0029C62A8B|nr:nucleotidyltransferase domain-containing protein [uncultured Desulfobacter sp.]